MTRMPVDINPLFFWVEISTPLTLIKDLALGVVGQLYEYFLNRYDMASYHLSNLKFTSAKHNYQSFYQICIYFNVKVKKAHDGDYRNIRRHGKCCNLRTSRLRVGRYGGLAAPWKMYNDSGATDDNSAR